MRKIILLFAICIAIFSCSGSDDSDSSSSNGCAKPIELGVTNLSNTNVTLQWASRANSSLYQVQYSTQGFTLGSGTVLTVPNTYAEVTDLQPQTQYAFYTRVFCNSTNRYSDWAGPYSFVTLEENPHCNVPSALYSDLATHNYIDINWSNGAFDGSQVAYGIEGITVDNANVITVNDEIYPSYKRVENLNAGTAYDFYVRNICENSGYSAWTGPITLNTLETPFNENCIDPTDFYSSGNGRLSGDHYFDFTWSYADFQNSWEITVVPAGTAFSANNTIATSYEPVRLSYFDMVSGQAYDFYIRANCGGSNGFSDWVGPVTVTAE
ncbi:fibronectin type III domain-containing protein [Bizionia sp. KMM 8389]